LAKVGAGFFPAPSPNKTMEDLQKNEPEHKIGINRVGITSLALPLKIKIGDEINHVHATVSAFVDLPENKRGTHMSRLVRILTEESKEPITFEQIEKILNSIKEKLEAEHSYLNIEFKLFDLKQAPVTKNEGYVNYTCFIEAEKNAIMKLKLGAEVFVTTLCPISKGVSEQSAHNQRGKIVVNALCKNNLVWFKDLITSVESCGSSELYSVLKREDEKFVTERAYNNPKIVEDTVREVANLLKQNKNISEFKVSCENLESIHLHNAFSEVIMKNG
jgi:GTP cyclohydrolase I